MTTTLTHENNSPDQSTNGSYESCIETSFFYTDDKFINSFDNKDILLALISKYPELSLTETDQHIKKALLKFLNDDNYVNYILVHFNMTIYDLIKIIYIHYPGIFKSAYLKKIKVLMDTKTYATRPTY